MTDLLAELVLDARPPCITEHPDFANVCLCRAVLTVSMHGHRYHYGASDIPMDENRYSYAAIILYALSNILYSTGNFDIWLIVK